MSRTFEGSPGDVAEARRFVSAVLGDRPDSTSIALCVSELATNAVVHAHSPFVVSISPTDPGVYVEVFDRSGAPPQAGAAGTTDERGRGLLLVDALATAWGSEPTPTGKVVWFETDGTRRL